MKSSGIHKFKYRKARRLQKEQNRRKKNLSRHAKCSYCKNRFNEKPRHITFSKNRFIKKKRITILLGAGAVLDWGAPGDINSTIIQDSKFMTSTGDETIGKFLFDKLKEYYQEEEGSCHYRVNFETFIAFLENIHQYIFAQTDENGNPMTSPFHPLLFTLNTIVDELKDFRTEEIPEKTDCVKLFIPKNNENFIEIEIGNVHRYYFSELLQHYLKLIIRTIKTYSGNIQDDEYNNQNHSFKQLFRHLKHKETVIRCYTTNYDDFLNKILGEDKIFDGFDKNTSIQGYRGFNFSKILTDKSCLNYYNLHGSIYWKYAYLQEVLGYVFIKNKDIVNEENDFNSPVYINPGNYIFNTNIITGYNKLQRTSIEPFSVFMQSFQNDCQNSELIITIGYSFSDSHINKILTESVLKNRRKFYHITKATDIEKFKECTSEYYVLSSIYNQTLNQIVPDWLESENVKIFLNGFKSYLENEEWKNIYWLK
jgi:hypothetical protein